MSADRIMLLVACGLCCGATAPAAEEETPDAEFIEYLGMWQESDEEWLLHDDTQTTDVDERSDPVPEGEESTETNDES